MKKYLIYTILILVLISVLTLKTTEVKAAGTLTWPDGSTATISRTVQNVYNAYGVDFAYKIMEADALEPVLPTTVSKAVVLGDRDGVPGPAIETILEDLGFDVVFSATNIELSDPMDATNQQYVLNAVNTYGAGNVVVVLGTGSTSTISDRASVITTGTGTITTTGPLIGNALHIPVYSIFDPVIKSVADSDMWEDQIGMMEMMYETDDELDDLIDAVKNVREAHSLCHKFTANSTSSGMCGDEPVSTKTLSFDGTETVSNTYTVNKSTTINLANVGLSFTEPGNYEYTVSESATSNNAYPTTNTEYTIVITVRNELNANNRPTGNLEARFYIKDSNDNKVNTMSFSAAKDESKFGHLELTKKVGGLMGGLNTYFDFSIQIDDAASNACSSYSGNEKYPVSGGDASHVTISEVTKCKSGTKDSLSLKHNQTAIIGQFTYNNNTYDSISIDDYYKIVEASVSDYTTTFKIGSGSSTSGRDTSSQSVSNGTNTVTYVNTREGSPLTGVILTVLPFLILIGIGAGGLILFRKKKGFKKIKKEELEVI